MGSAGVNFYNNAFERQGYGDDIREVQRLWLARDKDAARKPVPTAIGLGTNLIGTDDLVRDRLRLYRDAGITTLRANLNSGPEADLDRQLGDLERLLDLVRQVTTKIPKPRRTNHEQHKRTKRRGHRVVQGRSSQVPRSGWHELRLPGARAQGWRARGVLRAPRRDARQLGSADHRPDRPTASRHRVRQAGCRRVVREHTGTIEEMAEDAVAFIKALGFDQVDIFSFSLGGMVAHALVVRHPNSSAGSSSQAPDPLAGRTWTRSPG